MLADLQIGLGITNCDCLYILAVSTERVQYGALEDFSKENLTKQETSQSNAMEQMESESTKGSFKLVSLPILHPVLSSESCYLFIFILIFCHMLNNYKLT